MTNQQRTFWQSKPIDELTDREWESLCDGCGKCCRVRLQDDETEEIFNTSVSCKLLNIETCRCNNYANRKKIVPGCLILRPLTKQLFDLLPNTCAYRLVSENLDLPQWHPLISGTFDTVKDAGISVSGKVLSEEFIHPDDIENYIID